jgi:hypothetical protein
MKLAENPIDALRLFVDFISLRGEKIKTMKLAHAPKENICAMLRVFTHYRQCYRDRFLQRFIDSLYIPIIKCKYFAFFFTKELIFV